MILTDKIKHYAVPIYSVLAFFVAAIVTFLFGNLVISDITYSPTTPALDSLSGGELIVFFAQSSESALIQLALIFLSGFSVILFPVCIGIFIFRGISFGYTASLLSSGRLFLTTETLKIGEKVEIPTSAAVMVTYCIATMLIALFSLAASSFFKRVLSDSDICYTIFPEGVRYFYILLVFAGALSLCSIFKIMML